MSHIIITDISTGFQSGTAFRGVSIGDIAVQIMFGFDISEMKTIFLPQVPFKGMEISKSNLAIVNATCQVKIWRISMNMTDEKKQQFK